MSNQTLSIIVDILVDLSYTVAYLISAALVFIALRHPKVRQWLNPAGVLVRIIVFVATTVLLYWPLSYIISDLFSFVEALVERSEAYYPSVRCLGGVLVLAALTAGIVLLVKDSKPSSTQRVE